MAGENELREKVRRDRPPRPELWLLPLTADCLELHLLPKEVLFRLFSRGAQSDGVSRPAQQIRPPFQWAVGTAGDRESVGDSGQWSGIAAC
jgi:hypothetical protein